jgi:hypothetical protein
VNAFGATAALNDNVVANYPLNATMVDTANSYNLTNVGPVDITNQSKLGNGSATFNTGKYLTIPTTMPRLSDNMTFNVWINMTATSATAPYITEDWGPSTLNYLVYQETSAYKIHADFGNGGGVSDTELVSSTLPSNTWIMITVVRNGTNQKLYVNGTEVAANNGTTTGGITTVTRYFGKTSNNPNGYFFGAMDNPTFWSRAMTGDEITTLYALGVGQEYPFTNAAPLMSALNCTSCNVPLGDTVSPYATSDTTPTFKFQTDSNANCRIGVTDGNYSSLGSARNCTSGDGTTSHTCTLKAGDALPLGDGYVYIACQNAATLAESTASSSGGLLIQGVAVTDGDAIDYGIQNSAVWPGATVYSNQQVYLRNLSNGQVLATVDRVVVYGNQRWLINFDNTTTLGLFNITPVVYSLEMANITLTTIETRVATLINTTKQ